MEAAQVQGFQLPPLYRMSASGKEVIWLIAFDGKDLLMYWGRVEKLPLENLRNSRTAVQLNTSGRNLHEQALLEARARWKRKIDKDGYYEKATPTAPPPTHPILDMPAMLANKWDPTKNQIHRWPVWVEEKLDGVRCRANPDASGNAFLISRTRLVFSHLNHIRHDLVQFFPYITAILKRYMPNPIFRLDGELYTHDLTFDRISGLSRLSEKSPPDPEEYLVKYYMFDLVVPENWTYDERWAVLHEAFQAYEKDHPSNNLKILIPRIANSKEDILRAHDMYNNQGFEGVIIRKIDGKTEKERSESYYVGRRSSAILKYKAFQDEEGFIIGAEEGSGTEKGAVVWKVRRPSGEEFDVRPRGSIDIRKQYFQAWLNNPNQFIGLKYRYRFQELTPEGKPRFPVGVGFVFDRP